MKEESVVSDKAQPRARVSMLIDAQPTDVYTAFVEPAWLTRFWLDRASGALRVGQAIEWSFMVPGAVATVTATELDPGKVIAWRWSDGTVRIELEPFESGTAVTVVNEGFPGSAADQVDAALNGTEGFSIVLCDLKTLLETGRSAGLTRAKARLIVARQ